MSSGVSLHSGRLLNLMQAGFPIVSRPYVRLAEELDSTEAEVIRQIETLKAEGIVRVIGPLFDARRLGFTTTLAAARATGDELEKAVRALVEHPGVSHAYERGHHFNLWFTLAAPSSLDMDAELNKMFAGVKHEGVFSLPATRLFKLRTYFDAGGSQPPADDHDMKLDEAAAELTDTERGVINTLQRDLPLAPRPFAELAAGLDMDEEEFVLTCRSLLAQGIMRRFSASLDHHKVGFAANAMACWAVPEERVEEIGQKLAARKEVSHAYERRTNPLWRHNVFAMIHGRTRDECQRVAEGAAAETGLDDFMLLYSTREMKKQRVKYLV